MKHMNRMVSRLGSFSSGAGLAAWSRGIGKNKTSTRKVRLLTRFSTFKKQECGSPPERNIKQQQLPRSWAQMIFLASSASQGTPSHVHGCRVDRQLHTHDQEGKDAPNVSQKE
jgi:hypothetical protein